MNYEQIKRNYARGLWNEQMLEKCVEKGLLTSAQYEELTGGNAEEEFEAKLKRQVQKRLDDFAQKRGYDDILTACSYASSSVKQSAAEGKYCVALRDTTWAAFYAVMEGIEAGTRPCPASIDEIEDALPALKWPN